MGKIQATICHSRCDLFQVKFLAVVGILLLAELTQEQVRLFLLLPNFPLIPISGRLSWG